MWIKFNKLFSVSQVAFIRCIRQYNPKNTNKQHKAEFNKCNKPVLVSTLEYLKVPGQDAFTKPACINTVICRIQNLLPDICNICHKEYCVKLSETSLLTCEICCQGSHNECILHKMNVSEEDIDAFGQQEATARLNPTGLPGVHYLCGACESSTIPDKEAGMLKRKSTVQNETRDDSQQTQRTEDEEPEEESTTSTEDHSRLQQQETQQPPDTASQSGQAEGTCNSPDSRKVCPFYRKGTCRHGLSGKGCPNEHPKPCKKLIQHGNKAPNGCTLGRANCDKFHPKMCHSSITKGICFNKDCRLKHVNGTQRTPTAIPETKEKMAQESNTGPDTTDTTQAAVQMNIPNDFLKAIRLLRLELMEAIDTKLAMNMSQAPQQPVTSTAPLTVTSQNPTGVMPPGMPPGMPMVYPLPGSTPMMYLPSLAVSRCVFGA